jgi:metallo-beta-lactamase class B
VGNVYYVGASGVSAFLITTKAGSILLDGGLPETAPLIARNIATLGYRLEDVKLLLNSHAHFDHAGGLAELKRRSGARLLVSQGDAPAVRRGGPDQPAVEVDKEIKDGERVELGGTVLTAHVTPGHTRGCTTWSMTAKDGEQQRRVVFHCSTSVVDRLLDNAAYPEIVADYERSFRALRELPCDVFLAPHPWFFGLDEKRQKLQPGAPNPFIDPGELRRFVDKSEQDFRKALEAQRSQPAAAEPSTPKPAAPKPAAPKPAPHPAAS